MEMKIKNKTGMNIAAAVILVLMSLFTVAGFRKNFNIAFSIVFAISLIRNKKDALALIGAAGLTLSRLIVLIMYFSIGNLLSVLAYASIFALLLIIVVPTIDSGKVFGENPERLRGLAACIPAAVALIANIASILQISITMIMYGVSGHVIFTSILSSLLFGIAEASALLLIGAWVTDEEVPVREMPPLENINFKAENERKKEGEPRDDGYYDLAMHVILLLVTCGIWQCIWIYRTTDYLNRCPGEEYRDPVSKLLLCMLVPFYYIYWTYKSAQRVDKMSAAKGIPCDIATLCLILSIFVAIVPPILIQMKINGLTESTAKPQSSAPEQQASPQAVASSIDAADEIRKFKELLDSGAITQEEYDAKKKQLLDI